MFSILEHGLTASELVCFAAAWFCIVLPRSIPSINEYVRRSTMIVTVTYYGILLSRFERHVPTCSSDSVGAQHHQ